MQTLLAITLAADHLLVASGWRNHNLTKPRRRQAGLRSFCWARARLIPIRTAAGPATAVVV